jgi:uncharacterized membrane protein
MEKDQGIHKHLKGWQILLIADVFILIGSFNGIIATLANLVGFVLILFAIATGIANLVKKKQGNAPLDISMTIIAVIGLAIAFSIVGSTI